MATSWVEMKPGDFLKAISSWDDPRSITTVKSEPWIPWVLFDSRSGSTPLLGIFFFRL